MTSEERDELKKKLSIFQRQEQKLAQAIEESRSLLEELRVQQEQYPQDSTIREEIDRVQTFLRAKENEYDSLTTKIVGVKWLLED